MVRGSEKSYKCYRSHGLDGRHSMSGKLPKIIIWKAQGVPRQNNVAHPKHPEEVETSPTETTNLQVNNGKQISFLFPNRGN